MPCIRSGNMILCYTRKSSPSALCEFPNCKNIGGLRCDYEVDLGRTCDRYVCHRHSWRESFNRDICWEHKKGWVLRPVRVRQSTQTSRDQEVTHGNLPFPNRSKRHYEAGENEDKNCGGNDRDPREV